MIEQLVFYLFAIVLVLSAVMVVVARNTVHAALFLVLSFFSSAAIWLLLYAEFLAIVLVLIYVGAVMVLFMFVVMLLDINLVMIREGFTRYLPVGIVIAVLMVVAMGLVVGSHYFMADQFMPMMPDENTESNTKALGNLLYTQYLYQFEIAGAILLVAIIAAISLAMSKAKSTKTQQQQLQVLAKKKDRLRIIKFPSEENKP